MQIFGDLPVTTVTRPFKDIMSGIDLDLHASSVEAPSFTAGALLLSVEACRLQGEVPCRLSIVVSILAQGFGRTSLVGKGDGDPLRYRTR